MFTFKKLFVYMLIFAVLLGGCSNIPPVGSAPTDTESTQPTETELTQPTEAELKVACQYLPQEVENPDNVPVLKWVCLTNRLYGGGTRLWNETAALELNQLLADRNMPFRIQFVLFTVGQLEYLEWFSRPEVQEELEDADLIYGVMTSAEMTEYLLPITEYVNGNAEPSLQKAVPHPLNWLSGTVDGQVFGIRTLPAQAGSNGWTVDTELLTACGLTEEDFLSNFWEMDGVFQKIYESNGGKPFLYVRPESLLTASDPYTGSQPSVFPGVISDYINNTYNSIGSCFRIPYGTQTPTVVNMLETDAVRSIQRAIQRYKAAGYTTGNMSGAQVSYGSTIGNKPYISSSGEITIPVTDAIFTATGSYGYMSGVAADAQHKEEALSLLKLIADDEPFRMQLFYGKEGRDYTVVDGYYTLEKYADGSSYSMDFISPLSYFCGLTSDRATADMRSPGTENWRFISYEGKTLLQSYQDILDESAMKCPVDLDFSGFEDELAAMQTVFEKYYHRYSTLTDDQYNQMLTELEEAGSKQVQEALQSQLDQWLSENPDWQ